jgi:hypothetical protein
MLTLVHTIALTIANTLRKMPSLWSQLQRSVAQARADRTRVEADYRPEAHYMRGPGPKWREKNAQMSTRM